MKFTDLDIITLYKLKSSLLNDDKSDKSELENIKEAIQVKELQLENDFKLINEDTSATGGLSVGGECGSTGTAYVTQGNVAGMGSIVSPQPGALPGTTGTTGSGDVSAPYNADPKKMIQKIPIMGYYHGSRTGKKSRINRGMIKNLKKMKDMKSRISATNNQEENGEIAKKSKIWNFDDFAKSDINKVKR